MLEKSNTWPEHVLDTLNSCWRALLESCSNTQANVRSGPLLAARLTALYTVTYRSPTLRALLSLLSHSELTVLEGSSGSDDGPVVSVVPEVI